MNIMIAGASGFIGRALVHALKHHHITVLGRDKAHLLRTFSKDATCYTWDELLKGQRVLPKRLLSNGYQFHYP